MSKQPIPETWLAPWNGPLRGFLFGLAPDGVFRASAIALGAVSSYLTFSPLLRWRLLTRRAVCFLWHYPSGRFTSSPPMCIPRLTLSGYMASRPMEFGLSSPDSRRERSSALPESTPSYTPGQIETSCQMYLPLMVSAECQGQALPRTIPAPRRAQSTRPVAGLFCC